jgi:hypothetical protein
MKSVFLFAIILIGTVSIAQPPTPNDKAKTFYDKFLKIVEEIKAKDAEKAVANVKPANAEGPVREGKSDVNGGSDNKKIVLKQLADNAMVQIGHIKKRDPGYDTAPLEAMVKPYIEAVQTDAKANKDRLMASVFHDSDEGCYGLFKANTTTEFRTSGNLAEDEKKHIEQLEAHNRKLQNILMNHMAGVETCKQYLADRTETAKNRALEFKSKITAAYDYRIVRSVYRDVLGEQAYWGAAKQLYPDVAAFTDVHKLLTDVAAMDGGLDGMLKKAAARKAERLKNIHMPPAVMINAGVEAEFKEAFGNGGWEEKILKINILSREWTVIRHSISGAILYRSINAAIATKQKDGNCILYNYTIKQQHTGSGFSNISSYSSHNVIEAEFLCENAK